MNVPGHAGLTLGAVYGLGYLFDALATRGQAQPASGASRLSRIWARLQVMPQSIQRLRMDLRLIILGSLLPDLIDKPVGFWLLPEVVNHATRNVGHSLLFNAGLLAAALVVLGLAGRTGPLLVGLGSIGHLLLDLMWQIPATLLWPFLGWQFPPGSTSLEEYILFNLNIADVLASPGEAVGFLLLIWFFVQLCFRRSLIRFLRTGLTGSG